MGKGGADRFDKLQQARAGAGAKRQQLAAQLHEANQKRADAVAAEVAKARRFSDIDIDAALSFVSTIPLQRFDLTFEGKGTVNRPTIELLRHFLGADRERVRARRETGHDR